MLEDFVSALKHQHARDIAARQAGCFSPRITSTPPIGKLPYKDEAIDAWLRENLVAGGDHFLSAALWLSKKEVLAALSRAGGTRKTARSHSDAVALLAEQLARKLRVPQPHIPYYYLF